MSDSEEFIFNNGYCERLKRFRGETNMTAEEMADLLGIPADRYRKYETRSPLPVYLVAKFCRIVGCDLEHLILGKPRERLRPVLVGRKAPSSADIAARVEALADPQRQSALDLISAASSKSGSLRKKGTRGN